MVNRRTIVLLFTTFPVPTETFLRREVEALRSGGASLELWSLWKGEARVDDLPVRRPHLWQLVALAWWLPYWAARRPRTLLRLLRPFFRRPPNHINFAENLLGLGLALRYAREFEQRRDAVVLHAVWASAPATFGWAVSCLSGAAFTFAAHAYDLFEDGGDWLLREKCRHARWIRTSTEAGAARLRAVGADADRIDVIRRGLVTLPDISRGPPVEPGRRLMILSVGRLVPKMGYAFQVEVYRILREHGVVFRAEIIGDGPERKTIGQLLETHGLEQQVRLRGALPFAEVEAALRRADVALFTGVVAPSGDQAGFPNFVGEAMAAGVPVVVTPVGGISEVIRDRENGWVGDSPEAIAAAVEEIAGDRAGAARLAGEARSWVEAHFRADRNMRRLHERLQAICE